MLSNELATAATRGIADRGLKGNRQDCATPSGAAAIFLGVRKRFRQKRTTVPEARARMLIVGRRRGRSE